MFGDQDTVLEVEVDQTPIAGSVTVNDTGDTWYALINTFDFPDQTHSLRVKALDSSGEVYDSYTIGFVERNGQSEPWVYITSPYENQYLLDRLELTGKYNAGHVSYIEVWIDDIYYGNASLDSSAGTWSFNIDTASLSPDDGFHLVYVDAYDDNDMNVESYSVYFAEADGAYAYIDYPSDSSTTTSDFTACGYFDVDAVKYIQIQINSGDLLDADTVDFSSGCWDYFVSVTSGSHTITVYAYDRYYNLLTTYQVPFNKI